WRRLRMTSKRVFKQMRYSQVDGSERCQGLLALKRCEAASSLPRLLPEHDSPTCEKAQNLR
ncbi:MAG: hypothetical protein NZL93_06810, partial [Chthoniobacterales bacterium]|nr:hypothetical protein [Chthoniobacterales bacterium]